MCSICLVVPCGRRSVDVPSVRSPRWCPSVSRLGAWWWWVWPLGKRRHAGEAISIRGWGSGPHQQLPLDVKSGGVVTLQRADIGTHICGQRCSNGNRYRARSCSFRACRDASSPSLTTPAEWPGSWRAAQQDNADEAHRSRLPRKDCQFGIGPSNQGFVLRQPPMRPGDEAKGAARLPCRRTLSSG